MTSVCHFILKIAYCLSINTSFGVFLRYLLIFQIVLSVFMSKLFHTITRMYKPIFGRINIGSRLLRYESKRTERFKVNGLLVNETMAYNDTPSALDDVIHFRPRKRSIYRKSTDFLV